ncbi:MAG: OmpA family protein [Bacteroidetes bacterium]|nr:OmpA family protein [Bacteroidota bacterium]
MKNALILFSILFLITSCVSKKKFVELEGNKSDLQLKYEKLLVDNRYCIDQKESLQMELDNTKEELKNLSNVLVQSQADLANERNRYTALQKELDYFKNTNTNLLDRLSELSVLSQTGAESIKQSLETLSEQNKYIRDLTNSMQQKDSVNLVLAMNLKRSLSDIADEDVQIEVKKGVVYISLSDKMLFKTGSAIINPRASEVLGKIAKVVKDHQEMDLLVEGHTDNVPIKTGCFDDNWDLSTKRATSVVRLLQEQYEVNPNRMTAGGRGEYVPKASNDTAEGRSANRRTEIIILPKLDQFFKLLEAPATEDE